MADRRAFLGGLVAVGLVPLAARAHHGWAWAENEEFVLTGVFGLTLEQFNSQNVIAGLQVKSDEDVLFLYLTARHGTGGFIQAQRASVRKRKKKSA